MLIKRWTGPSMLSSMRQHVTRLQFDSCAKKDSLCGTVMIYDGLNLTCLDQCHSVRSKGTSSFQGWRKRIVIQESEFSLQRTASLFRTKLIFLVIFSFATYGDEQAVPRKALPRKQANAEIGHPMRPRVISPRAIFSWKNFIEQLRNILKWMLIEERRRPSMLSSMRQHVTRLQFDSWAKKQSLCRTVLIHDGLNLRCLDQCHCVRSRGRSSSRSWGKRIVIQESEFSL